jgi:CO dehydrogenase maturation factor
MTFTVAVTGKGGVGKTTLAALLVRALHERSGDVVMAVDADPNANLAEKLGAKPGKTIGDLREDLLKKADEIPAGQNKQDFVKYQMELAKVEGEFFDLLTMGRPEGPGCYCYINNILRTFLDLAMEGYEYVVIDNEAGMEHLSRRTTKKMDLLVVVSDPTKVGVETAVRILELAEEMKLEVKKKVLVINRVQLELHPTVHKLIDRALFDKVIEIPYDPSVERLTTVGKPVLEIAASNPVYAKVSEMAREFA